MSCRQFGTASIILFLLGILGCSGDDPPAPVEPGEPPPRPATGLHVFDTSPTRITLRWRDASDSETGFRIERRILPEVSFAQIDTVGPNQTGYEDSGVTQGQTYGYRVLSYRGSTASDPSNEATASAVANVAPLTPSTPTPENGAVEIDPDSSITLAWTSEDPDGDQLLFDVYFGSTRNALPLVSAGQTATSWPLNIQLQRNAHYFWQVVAHDAKGVTRPSLIWGFTTRVDRQTVPRGPFVMGDSLQFRHPGNPVQVETFNLDRHEVTNQQYADFLNLALNEGLIRLSGGVVYDQGGSRPYAELRVADLDSDFQFLTQDSAFVVTDGRESFPAIEVSWFGADAYARYFGRRLPTEAEWEKAARGTSPELGIFPETDSTVVGIGYPFPWGPLPQTNRGNFENSGDPFENQGRVRTTPVGFFDGSNRGGYATENGESPYGVQDLAGNVWEWCQDWSGEYRAPHAPPSTGHFRVIRGGSFLKAIGSSRTWNRSALDPNQTDRSVGFRTAAPGAAPG